MSANQPRPSRSRATSESILVAARKIARERGWAAVTIRAIGDELGYASPIIYEHFKNKEATIAAAARHGFQELAIALTSAKGEPGTDDRIVSLAHTYVAFAQRHPELYRVMHGMDGAETDAVTISEGAGLVCGIAHGEIVKWVEQTKAPVPDSLAATEALWCLVHGIVALTLARRLERADDAGTEYAVRAILAGWHVRS